MDVILSEAKDIGDGLVSMPLLYSRLRGDKKILLSSPLTKGKRPALHNRLSPLSKGDKGGFRLMTPRPEILRFAQNDSLGVF